MDMTIDVIDPRERYEVMVTGMSAGVALGKLDAIRPFKTVDRSDVFAVGGFDFHMFFDPVSLCHDGLLGCAPWNTTTSI
jgi:hypothetical protein